MPWICVYLYINPICFGMTSVEPLSTIYYTCYETLPIPQSNIHEKLWNPWLYNESPYTPHKTFNISSIHCKTGPLAINAWQFFVTNAKESFQQKIFMTSSSGKQDPVLFCLHAAKESIMFPPKQPATLFVVGKSLRPKRNDCMTNVRSSRFLLFR